jgi:hypothetical protein
VPVGSGLISGPRADEGSDMKKGHVNIIFLSYNWHKKTFPEIDELQCDADGKVYDIFRNCVIFFYISLPR